MSKWIVQQHLTTQLADVEISFTENELEALDVSALQMLKILQVLEDKLGAGREIGGDT